MTAAQAEKRCAPNLRDENLGNFQQARLIIAGEHAASTLLRGAVLHFLLSGFPRTFISELA